MICFGRRCLRGLAIVAILSLAMKSWAAVPTPKTTPPATPKTGTPAPATPKTSVPAPAKADPTPTAPKTGSAPATPPAKDAKTDFAPAAADTTGTPVKADTKTEAAKPEAPAADKTDKSDVKAEPAAPEVRAPNNVLLVKGMQTLKAPDPNGDEAGKLPAPASDGQGDDPEKLTTQTAYQFILHNVVSINIMWTLVTGFLVMFMQLGFMFVEVGLCRAKNSANMASMNLMIYPLGCLAFWVYGFAIGWGNFNHGPTPPGWSPSLGHGLELLDKGVGIGPKTQKDPKTDKDVATGEYTWGLMGTKGFFLHNLDDVGIMAYFFFMMVFMDTTATIPTGALAERWAWKNFVLFGLWVALPYCLFANWVWGGGWLAQLGTNWGWGHGAVDFAGSGVVHAMGGVIGLAGIMVLGPRIGKYIDGRPRPIPAHHVPMVIAGTFVLAFGWFGFNPGSTLSGTDLRISVIAVNTMLASVTGGIGAMCILYVKGLKPDPTLMCNGILSGLVAITAPCAFVDSWAAALIGLVAGVLVVYSIFFWEGIGIDDPVGAVSVHGVNGVWGVIALGLFANGKYGDGYNAIKGGVKGLFFGDTGQFKAQLLDAGVVVVFGFVMAYVWFKISNLITPMRVTAEAELAGLDVPLMGAEGYPDFTVAKLTR